MQILTEIQIPRDLTLRRTRPALTYRWWLLLSTGYHSKFTSQSVRSFFFLRVGSIQQHLCLKRIKLQLIEGVLLLFLGREMGILKQSLNNGAIDKRTFE